MKKEELMHRILSIIAILVMSYSFSSCGEEINTISESIAEEGSEEAATPLPHDIHFTQEQYTASTETVSFCLDFFKKAYENCSNEKKQNLFISPLSMTMTLTMLANGGNEATVEEITKVLGCDLNTLNSYCQLISGTLAKADNQVKCNFANSLWVSPSVEIDDSYISLLKDSFSSEIFVRDLSKNESKDEINQWYFNNSGGMISDFLRSPIGDPAAFLIGNALFFHGKWSIPFKEENTYKEIFHSVDGEESLIEMMHYKEAKLLYARPQQGGTLVKISFGNTIFEMELYLPDNDKNIDDCVPFLDSILLTEYRYKKPFNLALPKFNVRTRIENCKDLLSKCGVKSVFEPGSFNWNDDSKLLSLTHEAVIEIDESGAKAAAASGGVWLCNGIVYERDVEDIKFDRPFIFRILCHGVPFFMGVVNNI